MNPNYRTTPAAEAYLKILTAAYKYDLFVFAELPGWAGNRVVDRVELLVYNKDRAANRALIKQMTTKLHKWCAAQGTTTEVVLVKALMEKETLTGNEIRALIGMPPAKEPVPLQARAKLKAPEPKPKEPEAPKEEEEEEATKEDEETTIIVVLRQDEDSSDRPN